METGEERPAAAKLAGIAEGDEDEDARLKRINKKVD